MNADDITIAAARAATPPKSQLDVLGQRVYELEARVNALSEQNSRIVALMDQIYKMQLAMVEEVRQRVADFTTAAEKVSQAMQMAQQGIDS
jgi:hypothetical protein